MGYRSDVRILVSSEGYKELYNYVKKEALKYADDDYDYNLLNHMDKKLIKNKDQVLLCWDYVKWNNVVNYDVKIIMNGLDFLDENGYSFRYVRIGENLDDISELYVDHDIDNWIDYIGIIRTFDVEGFEEVGINE